MQYDILQYDRVLPPALSELESLLELDVRSNQLAALPEDLLSRLSALQLLDAGENKISQVESGREDLSFLITLPDICTQTHSLHHSASSFPPPSLASSFLCQRGAVAVAPGV